jgi:hypothetical protein
MCPSIDSPTASGQPIDASKVRDVRRRSCGDQCETGSLARTAQLAESGCKAGENTRSTGLSSARPHGFSRRSFRLGTATRLRNDPSGAWQQPEPDQIGHAKVGSVLVARALCSRFWYHPPQQTIGFPLNLPPFHADNLSAARAGPEVQSERVLDQPTESSAASESVHQPHPKTEPAEPFQLSHRRSDFPFDLIFPA